MEDNRKVIIEQALNELGSSLEDVIRSLQNLGIKGWRKSCQGCPITNYLKTKVSLGDNEYIQSSQVGGSLVTRGDDDFDIGDKYTIFDVPFPVREFIDRFDVGEIPSLWK